jgi:pimeloyl-ACP methyl ester carboxylesterase
MRFAEKPRYYHVFYGTDPLMAAPEISRSRVRAILDSQQSGSLLIVDPGYRENVAGALNAFALIEHQLIKRGLLGAGKKYCEVLGVVWPGSWLVAGWWWAWSRADDAGKMQAEMIADLGLDATVILGHSLGCRVALETMRHAPPPVRFFKSMVLVGAALERAKLETNGEYCWYETHRPIWNLHSKHDNVLRWAFGLSMLGLGGGRQALGLHGPRAGKYDPARIVKIDASNEVQDHGDYKRSEAMYRALAEC